MSKMEALSAELQGCHILLVEDELLIALGLNGSLRDFGIAKVDIAASLAEAESRIEDNKYDAAILDVRMPDGMSFDLGQSLLESGTAVVFHSGHAQAEDFALFPKAGFCAKPAAPKTLIEALVSAKTALSEQGAKP